MDTATSLIGHIVDVQGGLLTASLVNEEQGQAPLVTIGDEDILVGQLGTYVAVKQGAVQLLALVSQMSEQEKVPPLGAIDAESDELRVPYAQRTIRLVPIGTLDENGSFERGIGAYPTTGAEVHAVGSANVDRIFSKFRSKGFEVGHLTSHPNLTACLDPAGLFSRHFAILGQTGAGKSWTVATLLQRAVQLMPKAHIILLDLHGEYSWDEAGVRHYAFDPAVVRHVDARVLEMPYWLMTYGELCDLLVDQTDYSAHNQTAVFRDALNDLRQAEGKRLGLDRTTIDTPVYFDLMALRSRIEANNGLVESTSTGKLVKGPLTGAFDNFLMRLDSRHNDVRYDFLFKPKVRTGSATLSTLLRDFVGLGNPKVPITIVDLSSVPFDVRPTVAAQVGRLAFEFNYWNPQYREFPILLVCEEAHIYIPRSSVSQFAGSRRSMERIAKEGRKYGVGLGVVSQRPHEVSETVLSQCGTFLCLRVANPDDQSYIRSLVPEAERDLVSTLAGLGRGEAMALGEAVPVPTRLKFHMPDPAPSSSDVDFYEQWKDGPMDIDVDTIVDRWRRQQR